MNSADLTPLYQALKEPNALVAAIVQDRQSKEVLMLAWMNREALDRTVESKVATFWSRSRNELWIKGATSGSTMHVFEMRFDCDADAIVLLVDPAGPACHTGSQSCFFHHIQISSQQS
jgi:phosphoribosyl-AMP cyclohydrolase